jgi:opacity protein-like surface antigen
MPLTGSGKGNGALADFRAGYNVPISSQILAGLQLEGTLSQVSAGQSAHLGPCSLACTAIFDRSDVGPITIDWMASVLGRLGGIHGDNNYLYGIGGWSFARLRSPLLTQIWAGNHADFGMVEKTFSANGPTIGAGWERKLDGNWSANVEYRYTRFSGAHVGTSSIFQNVPLGPAVSASEYQFSNDLHAVRIGVNYRPDMNAGR